MRNQPVTVTCPHCKNPGARLMPKLGDYSEYVCPNPDCGTYFISGTTERLIENGADPTTGHFQEGAGGRRFLVLPS